MALLLPWQQDGRRDADESQGLDRLSDLPDHILLLVLERLRGDVRSLARTCVLSRRWRTLPLLLSELKISVGTFAPADRGRTTAQLRRQATGSFTSASALRFFLATPTGGQRRAIRTLTLELYLSKLDYVCRLVGGAIARGEVRDLELVIQSGKKGQYFLWAAPENARVLRRFADRFMRLLRLGAPAAAMFGALRTLSLDDLCFRSPSDVGALLDACAALESLSLDGCGFADPSSVLAIDAPRSRLKVLHLEGLLAERVHLIQAPRLVDLVCNEWTSTSCPVTFGPGSAPCLQEITLEHQAETWQLSFSLSELLENANHLQILCLAFDNGMIWVQPENPKTLGAAFSCKLKELHLMDVFPEGDLSWTMFLLQAAPLLEYLSIQVHHNHACPEHEPDGQRAEELHDLEWEVPPGFRHRHLQELRIGGGIGDGKKGVGFARLVMERAVSLEQLVLDARITCEGCVAARRRDPSVVLSRFPEDKDGVDVMVGRIKDGIPTSARIDVYSASNRLYEY